MLHTREKYTGLRSYRPPFFTVSDDGFWNLNFYLVRCDFEWKAAGLAVEFGCSRKPYCAELACQIHVTGIQAYSLADKNKVCMLWLEVVAVGPLHDCCIYRRNILCEARVVGKIVLASAPDLDHNDTLQYRGISNVLARLHSKSEW